METNSSITIGGQLEEVYGYASVIERWPEILPHYRSVRIIQPGERERLVSMHCVRAFGVLHWQCRWRALQELRPEEGRILFSHVSGPARGMKVEWLLERKTDGTQTTIRHWQTSDRGLVSKFYWNRVLGPIFIRSIAEQTLACIKRLVEGETSNG